jgi:citrate lyase gamma subunit
MDSPDYSHNRVAVLEGLKIRLTETTVGVFDLGGMDEVIRAFDAARAELARRRAAELARAGWIV